MLRGLALHPPSRSAGVPASARWAVPPCKLGRAPQPGPFRDFDLIRFKPGFRQPRRPRHVNQWQVALELKDCERRREYVEAAKSRIRQLADIDADRERRGESVSGIAPRNPAHAVCPDNPVWLRPRRARARNNGGSARFERTR